MFLANSKRSNFLSDHWQSVNYDTMIQSFYETFAKNASKLQTIVLRIDFQYLFLCLFILLLIIIFSDTTTC